MKISGVSQFPSINAASTIDLMGFHGIYWTNNGIYNQHYGNFCVCVSKNRGLNNDIRPSYGYVDNKNWYKTGFGGTQFLYDWQTQLRNFNMYIYISLYICIYIYCRVIYVVTCTVNFILIIIYNNSRIHQHPHFKKQLQYSFGLVPPH
jgi:hypothetical protein